MNAFSHVPPGFRFHPTDEELVDYYLRKKIASKRIDLDVIKDVDLYKIEPWDLQELCKIGAEDENEWYFFSHKDKKYPTGTRTNRATKAGFWKATGRDKAICTKQSLVGMRKTLVFYKGRAPNGQKSDWIMHEYRLETNENGTPQEEGWVVCRVFKKRLATVPKMGDYDSPGWYEPDQLSFMTELDPPNNISHPYTSSLQHHYKCKQELELHYNLPPESFLQLPQLESPKLPYGFDRNHGCILQPPTTTHEEQLIYHNHSQNLNLFYEQGGDQMTDWRTMEKYVASQLSNDHDSSKQTNPQSFHLLEHANILALKSKGPESSDEFASTSASTCQAGLWK